MKYLSVTAQCVRVRVCVCVCVCVCVRVCVCVCVCVSLVGGVGRCGQVGGFLVVREDAPGLACNAVYSHDAPVRSAVHFTTASRRCGFCRIILNMRSNLQATCFGHPEGSHLPVRLGEMAAGPT